MKKAVSVNEKRVVNGTGDINQLAPFKYPWAWTYFLNANKNHWTPLDVNMTSDIHDFNHVLTDDEKHVYENVLAYLTTSDILAMRNIGLAVMEKMTAPELQIYQARQVYEEALHCYIEGTEVLTPDGFIDFREVQAGTEICQYSKLGKFEVVTHLGVTRDHYEGDMVVISGDNYHTVVTPNHRCVVDHYDRDHDIIKASDVTLEGNIFPVAQNVPHAYADAGDKYTSVVREVLNGIVPDINAVGAIPTVMAFEIMLTFVAMGVSHRDVPETTKGFMTTLAAQAGFIVTDDTYLEHRYIRGEDLSKSTMPYVGYVYSVGVPSTMIVTRYNGKVCISGNTWTYQHCIETLGIDQEEIYNRYRVVPEINGKIEMANRRLNSVMRPDIDLKDPDSLREFVMAYIFFAAIFEGCWFYNGFTPIFALQRRGLMTGTGEQLQYIMRDEVMHSSFGIRVVNTIIKEEDVTLDPKELEAMWLEAEAVEETYSGYILRKPILGYSQDTHMGQFRFIANRRARALNLPEPFPGAVNNVPWMDGQANIRKEKNFFETRVTEYQAGSSLEW